MADKVEFLSQFFENNSQTENYIVIVLAIIAIIVLIILIIAIYCFCIRSNEQQPEQDDDDIRYQQINRKPYWRRLFYDDRKQVVIPEPSPEPPPKVEVTHPSKDWRNYRYPAAKTNVPESPSQWNERRMQTNSREEQRNYDLNNKSVVDQMDR